MRALIKEGQAKQDRFIRRHLSQLRPFLSEKTKRKYESRNNNEDDSGEAAAAAGGADEAALAAQNVLAGQTAALHSAANPAAAAVPLPPTSEQDALADLKDDALPSSKVFVKQPSYIQNGVMREYQIHGLNWMINRHENCTGGILGDEMGEHMNAHCLSGWLSDQELRRRLLCLAIVSRLQPSLTVRASHLPFALLSLSRSGKDSSSDRFPFVFEIRAWYSGSSFDRRSSLCHVCLDGGIQTMVTGNESR